MFALPAAMKSGANLAYKRAGGGTQVPPPLSRGATVVEPNVELDCVVTDKNVKITAGKKLSGTESFPVYVQKNHTV